jgi:co-chaperonin GroES (HSP10)
MKHSYLEFDNIDDVKPGVGFVLIEAGPENDHIKMEVMDGTIELSIDTSYEPYKHAVTWGTVMAVNKEIEDETTTMELEAGDKLFFHYLCIPNAVRDNTWVLIKGKPYFLIQYDMCYCALRGEEIVPVNGWVLVSPIDEIIPESVCGFELADIREKKHSVKEGIVKYVGKPLNGEKNAAKLGDKILYMKLSDVPMQYYLHNSFGENLLRMKNKDIMAILN